MVQWLRQLSYVLSIRFKSRARREAENLMLREQLKIRGCMHLAAASVDWFDHAT
jgi:hypothetical protein